MNNFNKLFISCFALLLSIFIFSACQDDSLTPSENTSDVSGVLTDNNGNLIANAVISIVSNSKTATLESVISKDTSDEDGVFILKSIPENTANFSVEIEHSDFKSFKGTLASLIKKENEKRNLPLKLENNEDCCGKVSLNIKNEDGEVLNDVQVKLNKANNNQRKGYSNNEGNVSFDGLCQGDFWLRIAKEGYKVVEQEFNVSNCDPQQFNFALVPLPSQNDTCCEGKIVFKLLDSATSTLIANATVKLKKNGQVIREKVTDGTNLINLNELCEGDYTLHFYKDGYGEYDIPIHLECNDSLFIERQLLKDECCNGKLTVTPTDSTGSNVIPNTTIKLWKGNSLIATKKVVGNSGVTFTELCEGDYFVTMTNEHFQTVEFQVTIDCDEEANETRQMQKIVTCCDAVAKFYAMYDGTILSGAKITIKNLSTGYNVTKEFGTEALTFSELCEGVYSVRIAKEGYKVIEFSVEIDCNKDNVFEKQMQKNEVCCTAVMNLKIRDNKGNYIKDATVKLWLNNQVVKEVKTEEGLLKIQNLCEGNYFIEISAEGFNAIEFSKEIKCNADNLIEKTLVSNGTDCCNSVMKFTLKNGEGNFIANATIVVKKSGQVVETLKTNSSGFAAIDGLCEGTYTIVIEHDNYQRVEFSKEVGCNQTYELNKTLEAKSTLCCTGKVKLNIKDDSTKANMSNVVVRLWKGSTKIAEKKTDANGNVEFMELCEKTSYQISFNYEGYKGQEFNFELECGENKTFEKTMQKDICCDAVMKLIVKDNDTKAAIENATITIKDMEGNVLVQDGKTNIDGYFSIECCTKKYQITIKKDGYQTIETYWNINKCQDWQESFWLKK